MPIYEYKCDSCGKTHENFFNVPASKVIDPETCPDCSSKEYHRTVSAYSFDVPNGKMYYGKRDWKKNLSTVDQASVLLNQQEPY